MKPVVITCYDSGQELHVFTNDLNNSECLDHISHIDGVAVAWNLHYRSNEKEGSPYIDFVTLRKYPKDGWCKLEDSPISGGFSLTQAIKLSGLLNAAVAYLNSKVALE